MTTSPLLPPLPFATAELPGIGGVLRAEPAAFVVEELPLYEAAGEGTHLYVRLTKERQTTRELVDALERLFKLPRGSVGYAGLKDKDARTTQTLSIPLNAAPPGVEAEMAARIAGTLPVIVESAVLHRNKLRTGHLLGNRFHILVSQIALPRAEALARAEAIAVQLRAVGAPNFFGPQRFGGQGDNAEVGLELLLGKRRQRDQWLRRFLISSYQSQLCNQVLALRMERGAYTRLLSGDVAKKHATGGIFDVEELAVEQLRFDAQEISFTLPLYGAKMRRARDEAGALEAEVEAETGLTDSHWKAARIEGTRRMGRLLLSDLTIEAFSPASGADDEAGQEGTSALTLSFSLAKGGFATSVLREFMKSDSEPLPAQEVDVES